jgi:uncharacterized protein YeaO (DUF488 family)
MAIRVKRAYEAASPGDGTRILIDRLWPRGLAKKEAHIDLWLKEIAPSTELRQWFNHEPEKWKEFRQRYFVELRQRPAAVGRLIEAMRKGPVTLLFGSKEARFNNAMALKEFLRARVK